MKKFLTLFGLVFILIVACLFQVACTFHKEPLNDDVEEQPEAVVSSLPAMYINLYDENQAVYELSDVTKAAYVSSIISVQNTSEENLLDSAAAEFKGRGNGSWYCDKKGYRIKFKDKKTTLFGKKNKHWVLLACANFDDKTLFRNYLAFNMAQNVFDNIEYCTSARFIDLYVNQIFQGVYLLCEHVRVGEDRVNITSDYGELDTGYLIEYDKYALDDGGEEGVDYFRINGVKYPFTVHSPDPEDYVKDGKITKAEYQAQVAFIQDYVSQVYEAALNSDFTTFASLVDVDSFVDMYLLHELFKNTDTGYSSFYLYKKAGGKLYAGPPWDFDATVTAARGSSSPEGIYVADKVRQSSNFTASELYIALYQNAEFKHLIETRWAALSDAIVTFIDEQINDEVIADLKNSMARNFVRWENGLTIDTAMNRWVIDLQSMKLWFTNRINWLNQEWSID